MHERLEHRRELADLNEQLRSRAELARADFYAQMRVLHLFLGQEIIDTPRLVSIHPAANEGLTVNPQSWFTETWHLRLWCEYPGEEHPVDRSHEFTRPREWYEDAAPYLKWAALALRVLPVARHALALGETLVDRPDTSGKARPPGDLPSIGDIPALPPRADGSEFDADDLKAIRQGIHLTEALAELSAPAGPDSDAEAGMGRLGQLVDDRARYNHPSIRQIRLLLHDIGVMRDGVLVESDLRRTPPSPTAAWGQTSSVTTDGQPIWVCEHHWRHFTSQS